MADLATKEAEAAKAAKKAAEQAKLAEVQSAEKGSEPVVRPNRYHARMEKLVAKADAAAVETSSFGMGAYARVHS